MSGPRRRGRGRQLRYAFALLAGMYGAPSAALGQSAAPDLSARAIDEKSMRSGSTFLAPETLAQQNDLTVNPGMLWVEKGAKLWADPAGGSGKSCAACHGAPESLKGVATRYPKLDTAANRVLNLADRIQQCRVERQGAPVLPDEGEAILSLTALVAHQSRGLPLAVEIDAAARQHWEAGRALYYSRIGQLNLSCAQCHEQNWGKRLRNEPISQGHPNGYPAYRLEWQTLGSLERRLKACFLGVRAEPPEPAAEEMRDLELFLSWRGQGLTMETPAVRR